MATTGQILKKNLGLEKLKEVRVVRFITSSYKIIGVFYDSYRDMLVTNYRIKRYPRVATVFSGTDLYHGTRKYTTMTPPVDIEDYNGNLRGTLVVPIDLAGDRFIDDGKYSKVFESTKKPIREGFVDYVKSSEDRQNYSLHVDPNHKEIREIKEEGYNKDIRGIYLSNTGKTYVANASLLHRNIRRYLENYYNKELWLNEYGVYFKTNHFPQNNFISLIYTNIEALEDFQESTFYKKFLSEYRISAQHQILEQNLEFFIPKHTLNEITLYDLADAGNISDFTKQYRQSRTRKMGGNEAQQAKLVDLVIDEADNSITFQFLTEVTPYPEDPDHTWSEADPEANWRLKRNRSKVYEIQIKVLDFFSWLDVFEGEKVTKKELKEILQNSDVKISSTSPSFNWQGFAYWLTQIDASIYPQSIKPTRWDNYHGDGQAFLDKHTYGIARSIDFFLNQMAQKLNSKLKSRGLI